MAAFIGATVLASASYQMSRVVPTLPFVGPWLHLAIALAFLYVPMGMGRLGGWAVEGHQAAGLRFSSLFADVAAVGLAIVVTWPPFLLATLGFHQVVCGAVNGPSEPAPWLATYVSYFAAGCGRFLGLENAVFTWPKEPLLLFATQVLVVALPEEYFFRGFLQKALARRWPERRLLLGAPIGWASVLTNVLFALGHVLVSFGLYRMAVFIPGLVFSWLRNRTGTLVAAILFHALCNFLQETLAVSFFW